MDSEKDTKSSYYVVITIEVVSISCVIFFKIINDISANSIRDIFDNFVVMFPRNFELLYARSNV